ncbi:MAG: enoyl-CoA hydratase-related protein [Synoicihabitans sp.]
MSTRLELTRQATHWDLTLVATGNKPPTIDYNLLSDFMDVLGEVEDAVSSAARVGPRCLFLSSSSPRCFCAGANINILETLSGETMSDWVTQGHEVLNRLEDLPLPVVAKVQGYALGGGLELALAADLIACDQSAQLGLTEANIGFVPGWGGTFRLPRRVGPAAAKRMFFNAERVTAADALSMGLVDFVVEDTAWSDWGVNFAQEISAKSEVGIRGFKSILHDRDRIDREASREAEIKHSLACITDSDTQRRIRQFLDRKKS